MFRKKILSIITLIITSIGIIIAVAQLYKKDIASSNNESSTKGSASPIINNSEGNVNINIKQK